jgi:hypothetical protein
LAGLAGIFVMPARAWAIRPFVTDDARVVGHRAGQFESWVLVDPLRLEHNILLALGPTPWLELAVGGTHGGVFSGPARGYSVTGPLLQVKALAVPARDNRWPGVAVTVGAFPPVGIGEFTRPGWHGFAYLALTESLFDEWLLIHVNVGAVVADRGPHPHPLPYGAELLSDPQRRTGVLVTGGIGAQLRVYKGFHPIAEVYYGDPFELDSGFPAAQIGFRYIFSEEVQIDGTWGTSLRPIAAHGGPSQYEQWGTLGIRLVLPDMWGPHSRRRGDRHPPHHSDASRARARA